MRGSALLLLLAIACADTAPPRWPADGDLGASEIAADALTLSWPAATDEAGAVAHYQVLQEDDVIATVSASTREHRVERLEGSTEYRFGVLPIDDSGNEGGRLYLTVSTADGTPPGWNRGARLTMTEEADPANPEAAPVRTLHWGGATDAVGVAGYRVRVDGRILAEVEATQLQLDADAATGEGHEIDVLAYDAAGNESVPLRLASVLAQGEGEAEAADPNAETTVEPRQAPPEAASAIRQQLEQAAPSVRVNRAVLTPRLRGVQGLMLQR